MLDTLITSKTRIKLLLKFFLNSKTQSYLRNLENEFGESSNAIRVELNRFEDAGLLTSSLSGNKKMYMANTKHPLYNDIHNIILKFVGFDQILDKVTSQVGDLKAAYITGKFAIGLDSQVIDLILVGDKLDRNYIVTLVEKAEKLTMRKIRFLILTMEEAFVHFKDIPHLLIWKKDDVGDTNNVN
ncbi:MAG: transcriptional regulator [Bacteroidetes bacterium GWF2_42_66]|nr:MAG: transcriptional regulator [Bacteroidetes bacterium GWA2_42_15]OFX96341.1 MAG: transcriptional regulator [Bacteroidetes bacterium GWE2_42_39]OFY46380.1 MAG: transcriptional regulator [Bacteroidetes bacterium GWF2_42_66]